MELLRLVCNGKIEAFFLPSLAIAFQTAILFLSGILNLLPEAAMGLYLLGFCTLLYEIRKKASGYAASILSTYRNPCYATFLLILLASAIYLRGKVFTHYDNFSHWALVVQEMLTNDRFPNFKDRLIQFQEYPLGSSVFVYFFAKQTSPPAESIQMLAQTYMMASAVLPLFAFAKKHSLPVCVLVISFTYLAFNFNTFITDLLVDSLLPLVGACSLSFALLHCRKGCTRTELLYSALYGIQLIQIKNAGVFFAAILTLAALKGAWQHRYRLHCLLLLALPYLSLLLWQKHCAYVFNSALTTKHTMSFAYYADVSRQKSISEMITIFKLVVKFSLVWKITWLTVAYCVLSSSLILLLGRRKDALKLFLFSAGLYTVYQLSLLAMYLFSMPTSEAIELASIERYTKTILLFLVYLNTIPVVRLLSEPSPKRSAAILCSVFPLFFLLLYMPEHSIRAVLPHTASAEARSWLETAVNNYQVPNEDSYSIFLTYSDSGYNYYLMRYRFRSIAVSATDAADLEEEADLSAHYIFVTDPNDTDIRQWVQTHFPDQVGNQVIFNLPETSRP